MGGCNQNRDRGGRAFGVLTAARLLAAMGLAVLAACAGSPLDSRSDLELTWERALVLWPGEASGKPQTARLEEAAFARWAENQRDRRWPVVVYLHGCTGYGNFEFFERLASEGYVVVAPDSFARRFRPLQCDPKTRTGGYNLFVYDFRHAEAAYAVQRLSEAAWADPRNFFLMGASEGGAAAALYRGDEFRARVITQWTCTGRTNVRGLAGPVDAPVLAIVQARDPWYDPRRAPNQRGHCGDYMGDRPGSRSIVLERDSHHVDPDREVHDVYDDPATVETILEFVASNRGR